MPDQFTPYERDDDGNIINPPIIAEHERRMTDACASADESQIAIAQEDYDAQRARVADDHNDRVNQRQRDDARLLAEDRARQDRDAADRRAAAERDADRRRADELRAREDADRAVEPSPPPTIEPNPGTPEPDTGVDPNHSDDPAPVPPDPPTNPTPRGLGRVGPVNGGETR